MTRQGFILGRFMPPHAGHDFLFRTARLLCDGLTILVCSNDAEPMDGAMRAGWVRAMAPGARVVHLHRNLPQTPSESPDFWPLCTVAIRETTDIAPTHVFGAEPSVFDLARALGAAPMLIDPARLAYPVSSSLIRADPAAHWRFVPRAVRPHYQKRLTLLGPESVGKTRLAADLAALFGTLAMPEYGRAFDTHYKQGGNWQAEDLLALAQTHGAMRSALAPDAGPLLVEDTDAVQTAVWSQHLVGTVAPALAALERETRADHYLLLAPDVAWAQDGVRYAGDPATRAFFFDEAARRLRNIGARYDVIGGADFDARRSAAIEIAKRAPGLRACFGA